MKRYTGGLDLYHTMTKLQIPRVSKEYGHVLKFSDPKYNEHLTQEQDFIMIAQLAAESKNEKLIDIVNKSLDETFDTACQFHNFILK